MFRDASYAAAVTLDIEFDGRLVGHTRPHGWLALDAAPGRHTLTSLASNADSIELDLVAGRVYCIRQAVRMGPLWAHGTLHPSEPDKHPPVPAKRIRAGSILRREPRVLDRRPFAHRFVRFVR